MSGGNSSSSSESLQISSGISSCSEIVMHVHNLMHVYSNSYGLGALYYYTKFYGVGCYSRGACMQNCGDRATCHLTAYRITFERAI